MTLREKQLPRLVYLAVLRFFISYCTSSNTFASMIAGWLCSIKYCGNLLSLSFNLLVRISVRKYFVESHHPCKYHFAACSQSYLVATYSFQLKCGNSAPSSVGQWPMVFCYPGEKDVKEILKYLRFFTLQFFVLYSSG